MRRRPGRSGPSPQVGTRVLARVAHRLGSTLCASGSSAGGTSPASPCDSVIPSSGLAVRQPVDLGQQRRAGRARDPPERALQRAAKIAERRLRLGRAPSPGVGRQVALAVKRHRDAEQALDHALVDLAREVDPLLKLLERLRARSRRSAPPPPAPRPCRASTAAGARSRRSADRPSARSARITPITRLGGRHRRADEPHRLARPAPHIPAGTGHADRRSSSITWSVRRRLGGDRCRLDRDVGAGKVREIEPVSAGRAHPPARVVVAEDQRAAHAGEPADRLAQPRRRTRRRRSARAPTGRGRRRTAPAPRPRRHPDSCRRCSSPRTDRWPRSSHRPRAINVPRRPRGVRWRAPRPARSGSFPHRLRVAKSSSRSM